jgi:hypothetical protein
MNWKLGIPIFLSSKILFHHDQSDGDGDVDNWLEGGVILEILFVSFP